MGVIIGRKLREPAEGESVPIMESIHVTTAPDAPKRGLLSLQSINELKRGLKRLAAQTAAGRQKALAWLRQKTRAAVTAAQPTAERFGRQAAAAWRAFEPKAKAAGRQALTGARQAADQGGRWLVSAGRAAGAGLKKLGGLVKERLQAASDTFEHIQMRQKEHAERRREKKQFLGELMTKVSSDAAESAAPAPAEPAVVSKEKTVETTVVETPQAEIIETKIEEQVAREAPWPPPSPKPREPIWVRWRRPAPAAVGRAPATKPAIELRPRRRPPLAEAPEDKTRMHTILREQERLIIRQIVKQPRDIALYKRLGFVYMELEERSDAKECFEQALKLGSQDPLIRKELERLKARHVTV